MKRIGIIILSVILSAVGAVLLLVLLPFAYLFSIALTRNEALRNKVTGRMDMTYTMLKMELFGKWQKKPKKRKEKQEVEVIEPELTNESIKELLDL